MRTCRRLLLCSLLPLMAACSGSSSSTTVVGPTERCAVAVSAPPSAIGPAGGTGTISVDTARECQWSASAEATWLTIMSGATGQGTSTVPFSAAPNRSTSTRRGTIAVNGQRAEITQEAATCSASVSPATLSVGAAGDNVGIAVTEQEFCAWTAVARVSWIAVTSSGDGTGNGEVRISVAANTGPQRSGSVDVAGREVVITQAAAPAQCSFGIAPANLSSGAAGDSATVTVTASPNCAWAAISEDPWITVRAGATGVGNGTVTLQVASNSGAARTGRVTIAGQTYTVTQAAAAASCSYNISPASASVDSAGASPTVSVTATNGCAWSAVSNAAWIVVTGTGSGSGNGSVTLAVAPNGGGPRMNTVTIAGQTYSVTQSAGSPLTQCTFTVAPESVPVGPTGGPASVAVTTGSSCSWNVSTSDSWITFAGGGSRTGPGTVQLTIASNTSGARTGNVSIAGRTVSIQQAAGATCSYSLNPTSASPDAAGGSTTVAVTTTSGCAWTTTGAPSWITVTGGSGTGNGSVTVAVQANTGAARTATLTIAGQPFVVTQAAAGATCSYSLNPTSASPAAAGGSTAVAVTAASGCAWTTTGAPSWITVTGGSGTGNGSVTLAVQANTGAARTATVTIAGQPFVVTQAAAGAACTYSLNPTSASPAAAGGSTPIAVTTSSGCAWTTTDAPSWITVTGGSGTGNGSVTLAIQANTGTARTATLTIAGQPFVVNQAAAGPTCSYSINPTSASPTAAGDVTAVTVATTSGCAWTTTDAPLWIIVVGGGGTGNGSVTLTILPNIGAARTATLTIAGQSFVVSQAALLPACSYSINPTSASPTAAGGSTPVDVTTTSSCSWTTTGAPSWITVTGGSGTGNGSVTLAVEANTAAARTATLTIAGQSFVVNQAAAACTFVVSPTVIQVSDSPTTSTLTVSTSSHCAWTAAVTTGGSWLTITSGASGTGNGTVDVRIDPNNGSARTGTLNIAGEVVTINQDEKD